MSTLHTNDAPSSIVRLIDLGVQPFLLQATLVGIMAQRLLREICPFCKEAYELSVDVLRKRGLVVKTEGETLRLHRGKGCVKCRDTGYLGRIGIFEVLSVTEEIREMIKPTTSIEALKKTAVSNGMRTLRQDAVKKMLAGRTTFEEVLRVTFQQ